MKNYVLSTVTFAAISFTASQAFATDTAINHCINYKTEGEMCFIILPESKQILVQSSTNQDFNAVVMNQAAAYGFSVQTVTAKQWLKSIKQVDYGFDYFRAEDGGTLVIQVGYENGEKSWQCAAGTIGGALLGGVSGASVGPAGIIIGAIGGGLAGAAASCGKEITLDGKVRPSQQCKEEIESLPKCDDVPR